MRIHRSSLLLASLVLLARLGGAAPDDYLLQRWDTASGLPHNTVRSIAQTPAGYLWIGTENGLARFDGVRFENFEREDTPALQNPNVEFLQLDAAGRLWIGSRGHVAYWDGRRIVAEPWPLLAGDEPSELLLSRTNELIFGTAQGCVIWGRLAGPETGNGRPPRLGGRACLRWMRRGVSGDYLWAGICGK